MAPRKSDRAKRLAEIGAVLPQGQTKPNGGEVSIPGVKEITSPGTPASDAPVQDAQTLVDLTRLKIQQVEAFIETMNATAWKYVPTAYLLGKEKAAALGHPMDTSAEKDGEAIQRMLGENKTYLEGLKSDMLAEMANQNTPAQVEAVFEKFTSRAESYGEWLWQAFQTGYRGNLDGEVMVEFFGPADARSCATCLSRVAGNPYRASDAPTPGEGCECRSNCRHDLVPAGAIPRL